MVSEVDPITELKGIGEKTNQLFEKLNVKTVGDLIRYYPRSYEVYEEPVPIRQLQEGQIQTLTGVIYGRVQVSGNRKMQVTTIHVKDLTGTLTAIWFRMPYLRKTFQAGGTVTLRGRLVQRKSGLVMEHPEIFYPADRYQEKINTLQPVYALTAGLSNHTVAKAVGLALSELPDIPETLPESLRQKYDLVDLETAIHDIHFPADKSAYYQARERLVFEEFLHFITDLRRAKDVNERIPNAYPIHRTSGVDDFMNSLPYDLTKAQQKVLDEILSDLAGDTVMSRLIQGDVGSGKTIVAVIALLCAAQNGYQGAFMAPTEVLARQHYETITNLFGSTGVSVSVDLLTGSMTAKEKRETKERIKSGQTQIVIGTHALIQDTVDFKRLALVITDEQHRFGVKQREKLAEKGGAPHVLVMSATPIPRTLALIVYGDLDISVIDELPANRLPIKNCVVDTSYRQSAYAFMQKQVREGRQCYVICPMVEESDHLEVENVVDYASFLQEQVGDDIRVEYLHGKMSAAQKDDIMERFAQNEIQILVSTTVIEVGIDVPNATVMLIENADRFGLAQLHQLRGRVGRGTHQSYCIFMSASKSEQTRQRLEILNQTNDGFKIASEDLRLRGPGDLFGIRQSGMMNFRLGDVYQDAALLQKANEAADFQFGT